ncbi:putative prophage protein (ps3) [Actinokineospora spheciospongiae]|uniref:Putative prophage protein (Ps3) n=2 Tax=Actinokineospora spheciospongiae TaxID=909613 RepID=W7IRS0_9PSEU|nr:putative prophage protein (ps3) [Actinokineospora spheciospongiae]
MTAMKLQKLVYYSQAWHLVWEEEPLFTDRIEAWANGPVVPTLYQRHRQRWQLTGADDLGGDTTALTEAQRRTVDVILEHYGSKPANWLSELTHRESPWRDARSAAGLSDGERGNAEITHASMYEYYDGLTSTDAQDI